MELHYLMPVRMVMGRACIQQHAQAVRPLGKRAVIVTDPISGRASGALDDMCGALRTQGIACAVFDGVQSDPTVEAAQEAAVFAREQGAELIIAIGGGSSLDTGKAAALLSRQEMEEEAIAAGNYRQEALPLVCVPTTSGTGSEVTPFAILTGSGKRGKINLNAPCLFAKLAFLDPQYTQSLPRTVTIDTTIDAVSHTVESLLTPEPGPLIRGVALEALRCAAGPLQKLAEGELDPADRERMMLAALMSGITVGQTRTTVLHGMSYPITVKKHISHGRSVGLLLVPYLRFVQAGAPGQVDEILQALGLEELSRLEELVQTLMGSRDQAEPEELEQFAQEAIGRRNIQNSRVPPGKADILHIYRQAFPVQAPRQAGI